MIGHKAVEIPSFITDAIRDGETSLGDNPAFPQSHGNRLMLNLVASMVERVSEDVGGMSPEEAKRELGSLLTECSKHENGCSEALERACMNYVENIIDIPEDVVQFDVRLVDRVDVSGLRTLPEDNSDYTFDSIEDMGYLTTEVYKRRFINSLTCGASMYFGCDVEGYLADIFKIDPDLPSLYKRIIALNNYLLFCDGTNMSQSNGGKVNVVISDESAKPRIVAEGTAFPFLVCETLKGIFELAASHGLPDDRRRAEYVLSKTDYSSAEVWDSRLGMVLWDALYGQAGDVEPNLLIMRLSEMHSDDFNTLMNEVLAMTRRGKTMLDEIVDDINEEVERSEFDDFMSSQSERYPVNDAYMEADELITDDIEY